MKLYGPTLIPFSDYTQVARVMSEERLAQQSNAAVSILTALVGPESFWREERVAQMWYGYEWSLMQYGLALNNRRYELTKDEVVLDERKDFISLIRFGRRDSGLFIENISPPWLGNIRFHYSHQCSLWNSSKKNWRTGNDPDNYLLLKEAGWPSLPEIPLVLPRIDEKMLAKRKEAKQYGD